MERFAITKAEAAGENSAVETTAKALSAAGMPRLDPGESTDVWLATVIGPRGRGLWPLLGIRVGPIPVGPHPARPPSVFAWIYVS
jgi:hypothetical protein